MSLVSNTLPPGLEDARRLWFVFLVLGAVMFVAGVVAIICATATSYISILLWGWLLIVRGGIEVGSALLARRFRAALVHVILGVLAAVIGLLVITYPGQSVDALTFLLAAFLLIGGAVQAVVALFLLYPGWLYSLGAGVVAVVMGLLVLPYYKENDWFIGVCVGVELLSRGSAWAGIAFDLKKRRARPSA